MNTSNFFKTMALYNKWQNESLFKICDELSDKQLHLDRGIFFDSIFKTLNHIMNVDETIYSFVHTKILPKFDPSFIPYPEYNELKYARFEFDEKLFQESQGCSQDWLDDILESWSERLNRNRIVSRSFYYVQMFNGNTDLPYNPYYEF
jgi:uncharacterized damage-inducible protein DinB